MALEVLDCGSRVVYGEEDPSSEDEGSTARVVSSDVAGGEDGDAPGVKSDASMSSCNKAGFNPNDESSLTMRLITFFN